VPEEEIKEASKEVKKVIVPEWNLGQYIYEVQRIVKDKKVVGINRMNIVPLSPEEILQVILNEGNP
jgi:2-oxoglutarate ferredoxin oxidoreductase subunit alpha